MIIFVEYIFFLNKVLNIVIKSRFIRLKTMQNVDFVFFSSCGPAHRRDWEKKNSDNIC